MDHSLLERDEITLVGIQVNTSYDQEIEKNKGNIFPCVMNYYHNGLADKIANRKNPGTTICAYTHYTSDYKGDYTYFIGEEVSSIDGVDLEQFETLVVPKQNYAKFTTKPAPMPDVIINAWGKIWSMSPKDMGGQRQYRTDFEVYDERASDHEKIVMDLFIGIAPN